MLDNYVNNPDNQSSAKLPSKSISEIAKGQLDKQAAEKQNNIDLSKDDTSGGKNKKKGTKQAPLHSTPI